MKILLGRHDIDLDRRDKYGLTPLLRTAENGHEAVVRILLGRDDVDPNKPDNKGRTPLKCAAENGYPGVIALLQPPTTATYNTT